ncbi:hypothetical protein QP420_04525 [Bifidobacterium sp. UMB1197]|nr:hypothetical protein [Bifidobacterium sp. UMB1197]
MVVVGSPAATIFITNCNKLITIIRIEAAQPMFFKNRNSQTYKIKIWIISTSPSFKRGNSIFSIKKYYAKKIVPIKNNKQKLKEELCSVRRVYNWIHIMNDSFNFPFSISFITLLFSLLSDKVKTFLFLNSLNEIYWAIGVILVLIIAMKSFITYLEAHTYEKMMLIKDLL